MSTQVANPPSPRRTHASSPATMRDSLSPREEAAPAPAPCELPVKESAWADLPLSLCGAVLDCLCVDDGQLDPTYLAHRRSRSWSGHFRAVCRRYRSIHDTHLTRLRPYSLQLHDGATLVARFANVKHLTLVDHTNEDGTPGVAAALNPLSPALPPPAFPVGHRGGFSTAAATLKEVVQASPLQWACRCSVSMLKVASFVSALRQRGERLSSVPQAPRPQTAGCSSSTDCSS